MKKLQPKTAKIRAAILAVTNEEEALSLRQIAIMWAKLNGYQEPLIETHRSFTLGPFHFKRVMNNAHSVVGTLLEDESKPIKVVIPDGKKYYFANPDYSRKNAKA